MAAVVEAQVIDALIGADPYTVEVRVRLPAPSSAPRDPPPKGTSRLTLPLCRQSPQLKLHRRFLMVKTQKMQFLLLPSSGKITTPPLAADAQVSPSRAAGPLPPVASPEAHWPGIRHGIQMST